MDLARIAVDPNKEVFGARVAIDEVTTIVVARFNNPKFRELQAKLMEPYVRKQGDEGVTTEQAEEILSKCLAEAVLLGWEGLLVNGNDIPYTPEKAFEILVDKRFIDFKERVLLESQKQAHYRLEALEDDLGNSDQSSTTSPNGRKSKSSSSKGSKKTSQA